MPLRSAAAYLQVHQGPVAVPSAPRRSSQSSDRGRRASELTEAVTRLAAKYHSDGGRAYRLLAAAHPVPEEEDS